MRWFKIFVFIMGIISFAFAQEKNFQFPQWALQFEVKDLLNFDYYRGSVLSMKYHFNNNYALRVGIGGRTETSKLKEENFTDSFSNSDSLVYRRDQTTNLNEIGLDLTLLRYFFINQPVKFYLGAGPILAYRFSKAEWKYPIGYSRKSDDQTKTYVISFRTICGVEWFFHSKMSLNLDYGLFATYSYRKTDRKQQAETNTKKTFDEKKWSINPVELRLGLSLYFK